MRPTSSSGRSAARWGSWRRRSGRRKLFTPDHAGFAKPDPRIFTLAGSSIHVGDTLLHDVLGPRLAGVTAIWLDAHLPDEIRAQPIRERVPQPAFRTYLEGVFETVPFRRFHPEATVATCTPDVVVANVLEAARAIVEEVRV